jgi:hypothetical protein
VLVAGYIALAGGDFRNLAPNAVGDFFAGAFAPLAFLWLLVAVLLQKQELELQRQELALSREALEKQAEETRALVLENRRSGDFALQDLEMRLAGGEDATIVGKILDVQKRIKFGASPLGLGAPFDRLGTSIPILIFGDSAEFEDPDAFLRTAVRGLKDVEEEMDGKMFVSDQDTIDELNGILNAVSAIADEISKQRHPNAWRRFTELELGTIVSRLPNVLKHLRAG